MDNSATTMTDLAKAYLTFGKRLKPCKHLNNNIDMLWWASNLDTHGLGVLECREAKWENQDFLNENLLWLTYHPPGEKTIQWHTQAITV